MAARKAEAFPIHILELSRIAVDHALQSRVSTSMEYQREFSEAMLRGDEFPPITVFFDGKKYWLADGFHRYGARKILARADRKFEGIRAEVRNGTKDDAVVFSAGANQKFSIPRTKEDVRKAIRMLLDIPDWRTKSSTLIAAHIGVSRATLCKHQAEYYSEKGLTPPEMLQAPNGKLYPSTKKPDGKPKITIDDRGRCKASIDGVVVQLGKDPGAAKSKLDEILSTKEARTLGPGSVSTFLSRKGFVFNAIDFSPPQACIKGLVGHDCLVTWAEFDSNISSVHAIGIAVCARQVVGDVARTVVLKLSGIGISEVFDIGRQLGIEFLTPDEFVASLKGDAGEQK